MYTATTVCFRSEPDGTVPTLIIHLGDFNTPTETRDELALCVQLVYKPNTQQSSSLLHGMLEPNDNYNDTYISLNWETLRTWLNKPRQLIQGLSFPKHTYILTTWNVQRIFICRRRNGLGVHANLYISLFHWLPSVPLYMCSQCI